MIRKANEEEPLESLSSCCPCSHWKESCLWRSPASQPMKHLSSEIQRKYLTMWFVDEQQSSWMVIFRRFLRFGWRTNEEKVLEVPSALLSFFFSSSFCSPPRRRCFVRCLFAFDAFNDISSNVVLQTNERTNEMDDGRKKAYRSIDEKSLAYTDTISTRRNSSRKINKRSSNWMCGQTNHMYTPLINSELQMKTEREEEEKNCLHMQECWRIFCQ